MKRTITIIVFVTVLSMLLLSGCAGKPTPSASPIISPSLLPTVTPLATVSPSMSATPGMSVSPSPGTSPSGTGTGMVDDKTNNTQAAEAIKAEVDKLSEVKESTVLVVGNVALVGITYTDQYQGGITDRLSEMVSEKAKAANSAIVTVAVTDDEAQITKMKDLAKRNGEDISKDFSSIVDEVQKKA